MGKTTSDRVAEVKKKATKDVPKIEGVQSAPTGCTLLDLITVERPFGRVVNIVGDKSSGKTFLSIELINACRKKFGDKLKWIYDDAERGFSFDTNKLYGFDVIEDMCDPDFVPSETVEKLSVNLDYYTESVKDDEFLIYVVDSLDALSSEAEIERIEERKKADKKGESLSIGTYAMEKSKFLSELFRILIGKIQDSNCLIIIVSQVRDNVGVSFGEKHRRSGGKALDFYAHTCLWLAEAEKHRQKNRVTGVTIKAKTKKSKTSRPFREGLIDIIFDYGVDNIGTNINYLFDLKTPEGKTRAKRTKVEWDGEEHTRDSLIAFIEENNLEDELAKRVVDKWEAIEASIASNRKKRM